MKIELATNFYNNAGVLKINAPFSERSTAIIDRIRGYCEKLIFQNSRTLEIGCGNGRYSFEFEKMGAIATGIDCADVVIEYANNFAKQINSTSNFIIGDALNMPFKAKEFDIIFLVSNNIVEFSYDDANKICEQSCFALTDSGVFCIEIHDTLLQWNGRQFDLANYSYNNGQIISHYTIPDKGTYEYHSYFWTVAMAKHIFKNHFNKVDVFQTDEKRFWIECRK